jgi:hypothetical protein
MHFLVIIFLCVLFNYVVTCEDYIMSVIDEWMSLEHLWSDTDWRKPKYLGRKLSQCHFVHHKSDMDRPGIQPRPYGERLVTNHLSQWHRLLVICRQGLSTALLLMFWTDGRMLFNVTEFTVRLYTHICIQALFHSKCPSSGRSSLHCLPCTVLADKNTEQFLQCCGLIVALSHRRLCQGIHTVPLKYTLFYKWITILSQVSLFNIIHNFWYGIFYSECLGFGDLWIQDIYLSEHAKNLLKQRFPTDCSVCTSIDCILDLPLHCGVSDDQVPFSRQSLRPCPSNSKFGSHS